MERGQSLVGEGDEAEPYLELQAITLFMSVSFAWEDVVVASLIYETASSNQFGSSCALVIPNYGLIASRSRELPPSLFLSD